MLAQLEKQQKRTCIMPALVGHLVAAVVQRGATQKALSLLPPADDSLSF